jgi:DNA-binding GntR family transcriptional regulator
MPRQKEQISGLQAKLAAQIIAFIKSNDLEKNHHLKEDFLARHFGVSRSPVRGALTLLEAKGIIVQRPNRGFFLAVHSQDVDSSAIPLPIPDDEQLYSMLIEDRLKGELDDVQTETELMRRYKTRRSVVARVLARLTKERIIERSPGVGWTFLRAIDSVQAHYESYRLRLLVEPAGLLEPTFKLDARRLGNLRAVHEELMKRGIRRVSGFDMFRINADFHEMLASFSGNRFFLELIEQQNALRRLLEYEGFQNKQRMLQSCEEHLAIIKALESDDREWAASLLRRHLHVAMELATAYPEESAGDQSSKRDRDSVLMAT